MQQNAIGILIGYLLVIVIMLGGMAMIVGGPGLTGRLYRWLFVHLVREPLRRLLRLSGRHLARFLRWSARQLGHFLVYLGRQFGRGVRYAWVRFTT